MPGKEGSGLHFVSETAPKPLFLLMISELVAIQIS